MNKLRAFFEPQRGGGRKKGWPVAPLLLLFAGLTVRAQNEIPPPKAPLLPRAPERAEWVVTYRFDYDKAKDDGLLPRTGQKPSEAKSSPGVVPQETDISKDGKTYREVITWSDGHKTEKWIAKGLEVFDTPDGSVMRIMPPGAVYAPSYSDYSRSDFEDVEWISEGNYVGVRTWNGMPVYAFEVAANKHTPTPREKAARATGDPAAQTSSGTYVAYLDVHTQLPLYLDNGQIIRTFTYPKDNPKELAPPPKFAKALESWTKEIQRKTVAPPPL